MRKVFLIFFLILSASLLFSQEQTIEKTKIIQVGTEKLNNGIAEVLLENPPSGYYYVVLTPIEEYAELFVVTLKPDKFIVKSRNTSNTSFNYLVIEKKIKKKSFDEQLNKKH